MEHSAISDGTHFTRVPFRNSICKFVPIRERLSIRFRGDLFNVTNRAQYGAPNVDVSAENVGVITTTYSSYATGRGTPREL